MEVDLSKDVGKENEKYGKVTWRFYKYTGDEVVLVQNFVQSILKT